jgi:SAM-dependent methyltransferase
MSRRRPFPAEQWQRLVAPRRRELADPDHYLASFPLLAGCKVAVDLGAGPGFFSAALLASLGAGATLVAVDVEQRMLARLAERMPSEPRLTTVVAPLDALPFAAGSFDVGWCAFVMHEVGDRVAALKEIRRTVAGPLILLDWSPLASDHGPPVEERISAEAITISMVDAGYQVTGPTMITDQQYALIGR